MKNRRPGQAFRMIQLAAQMQEISEETLALRRLLQILTLTPTGLKSAQTTELRHIASKLHCPACKRPMRLRCQTGYPERMFFGCTGYPACTGTQTFPQVFGPPKEPSDKPERAKPTRGGTFAPTTHFNKATIALWIRKGLVLWQKTKPGFYPHPDYPTGFDSKGQHYTWKGGTLYQGDPPQEP